MIKKIALITIKKTGSWYKYLSKELQNDLDIILTAAKTFDKVFEANSKYNDQEDVILTIIKINDKNLKSLDYLSDRLKENQEFLTSIIEKLESMIFKYTKILKYTIKNRELAVK